MKESNIQPIATLHHLLDFDLSRFCSAEIQLKNILPEWINKANALKLKDVLYRYQDYVLKHAEKLEKFVEEEGITSLILKNPVMNAFIEETEEKLFNCSDAEVKDACLLASIQSINHYKISTYGTAAAFAKALGMEKTAAVFHEAEVNEKQIDDRLTQLANFEINTKAKSPILLSS
jgi:ferritin-like metal-binding protein YciE